MRISDWSSDVCSSDLLGGERLRILGGEQGAGMTGAEAPVMQPLLDGFGQREETEHVGDVTAALADRSGQHVLRVTELIPQPLITVRLFQPRQILAVDVLD